MERADVIIQSWETVESLIKNRTENNKFMQYDAELTNINNYQIEITVKFNNARIGTNVNPNDAPNDFTNYTFKGNLYIFFIDDRSLQIEGVDITRLAWKNYLIPTFID